jgi:hypothetical protein
MESHPSPVFDHFFSTGKVRVAPNQPTTVAKGMREKTSRTYSILPPLRERRISGFRIR